MTDTELAPEDRRLRMLRVVQTLGIILAGAYLLLSFGRWRADVDYAWLGLLSAAVALGAAGLATVRTRLTYWLFLVAIFIALLDLTDYVHALLFVGSFMILGALAALNIPDDEEALTIKRMMEDD